MDSVTMLIRDLDDPNEDVRAAAMQELTRQGRDAVPALSSYVETHKACQAQAALTVLARMGYPENAAALPVLVNELRCPYTFPPTYHQVLILLREIGEPILPLARQVLRAHADDDAWVRGVGYVLLALDESLLTDLAADLAGALRVGLKRDPWQYIEVMQLLERIGSPHADAAIPTICEYLLSAPSNESRFPEAERECLRDIKLAALKALSGFSNVSLRSVIPTLEQAKSDPDESVRQQASELLRRLERD